jgi:hypothetical protein
MNVTISFSQSPERATATRGRVQLVSAKNCYHFPTLATHKNIPYNCYGDELKALIEQFDTRFVDFQNKDSTFATVARPMDADVNNVPENL